MFWSRSSLCCSKHSNAIWRDPARDTSLLKSFLGSGLAKAQRCVDSALGDAPFLGPFLAYQQDQNLSVLPSAVSQSPGLKDRRSRQRRGVRLGETSSAPPKKARVRPIP